MKNINQFINSALRIANWLFLGIIILCLLAIIVVAIEAWGEYHLRIDIEGISTMLAFWMKFKPLFTLLGACLTLLVINTNLLRYVNAETVRALGYVRERLQDDKKKDLHKYLLENSDKEPIIKDPQAHFENIEILDYLGTLELGAIMLKNEIISEKLFRNQFGYRVDNIKKNKDLLNHIKDSRNDYIYLAELLQL